MKTVQLKVLASMFFVAGFTGAPLLASAATLSCEDIFRTAPVVREHIGHEGRRNMAALLERSGLSSSAYTVQWKLKETSNPGPYPTSGEFLAVAVPFGKVSRWAETVGRKTIGLAVEGLPGENDFHSATLRVGTRLYDWNDIQDNGSFTELNHDPLYQSFTEATFFVTEKEMKAIEKFIKDRTDGGIRAVKKIRNGPDVGQHIQPDFDYSKNSLTEESCAGACSSFYNLLWLAQYKGLEPDGAVNPEQQARTDAAMTLENLRVRLGLESTPAAKAMVWRHARKANLMAITQVGIPSDEASDFIKNNKWGQLKDMPVYSLIPDPKGGENNQVIATRTPLAEWLARD